MIPAGWAWDAPDYSVGIMTGGWVHEECDGEDEVLEELLHAVRNERTCEVTIWYRLTCPGCAQQRIVTDTDWDPADQYDDEWELNPDYIDALPEDVV